MPQMTVPQMVTLAVEVLGGLALFRIVLWHACNVDDRPARYRGRHLAYVFMFAAARRQPAAPLPVAATTGPVEHVGADMDWHPALEVAAPAPAAVVAGEHGPDLDEQLILADFDELIASWRVDPPWLTDWRETVDAAYALAGLDTEVHHRWRYGVLDVPTGEYRLVPGEG